MSSASLSSIIAQDDVVELERYLHHVNNVDAKAECNWPKAPDILQHSPTLISYAAFEGAEQCFQLLQISDASLSISDAEGRLPVHFASAGGSITICDLLDSAGADFKVTDNFGMTCLHYACKYGRLDVVRRFEARSFDLHQPDANGLMPIHYAAYAPTAATMAFLVDKGCDMNLAVTVKGERESPFLIAFRANSGEVLRYLVKRRVNTKVVLRDSRTPLMDACYHGNLDIVQVLLENDEEDVDYTEDKLGWTPLLYAAQNGFLEICKLLVERGANVNKGTTHKFLPTKAAHNGTRKEIEDYLLSKGGLYDLPANSRPKGS